MNITEKSDTVRILTPDEGKYLYKESERIIGQSVFLAVNASADEWAEISAERKEELEAQWKEEEAAAEEAEEAARKEAENATKDDAEETALKAAEAEMGGREQSERPTPSINRPF